MQIARLDHLVLTVADIAATIAFYERVLGMRAITFGNGRLALEFGQQKINLHPARTPIEPHAARPVAGSANLCFITTTPIQEVETHLQRENVAIEAGATNQRTGSDYLCLLPPIRRKSARSLDVLIMPRQAARNQIRGFITRTMSSAVLPSLAAGTS